MKIIIFIHSKIIKLAVMIGITVELWFAITGEPIMYMLMILSTILAIISINLIIINIVYSNLQKCPYCGCKIDRESDPYTPNNYCGYCGESLAVIPKKDRSFKNIRYYE